MPQLLWVIVGMSRTRQNLTRRPNFLENQSFEDVRFTNRNYLSKYLAFLHLLKEKVRNFQKLESHKYLIKYYNI